MVLPCNIPPFDFNPRSREGSDRNSAHGCDSGNNFNPRSREGSDMAGPGTGVVAPVFQSALPRRERPLYFIACKIHSTISIRAPAKGATFPLSLDSPLLHYFNPRSREGSDFGEIPGWVSYDQFQSALPRRERLAFSASTLTAAKFQSALPRRERHQLFKIHERFYNFNPRSREGSDILMPTRYTD